MQHWGVGPQNDARGYSSFKALYRKYDIKMTKNQKEENYFGLKNMDNYFQNKIGNFYMKKTHFCFSIQKLIFIEFFLILKKNEKTSTWKEGICGHSLGA